MNTRWLKMKKLVFKEKCTYGSKTNHVWHFLGNIWELEDPYAIIFGGQVWQEWGHGRSIFSKRLVWQFVPKIKQKDVKIASKRFQNWELGPILSQNGDFTVTKLSKAFPAPKPQKKNQPKKEKIPGEKT